MINIDKIKDIQETCKKYQDSEKTENYKCVHCKYRIENKVNYFGYPTTIYGCVIGRTTKILNEMPRDWDIKRIEKLLSIINEREKKQ